MPVVAVSYVPEPITAGAHRRRASGDQMVPRQCPFSSPARVGPRSPLCLARLRTAAANPLPPESHRRPHSSPAQFRSPPSPTDHTTRRGIESSFECNKPRAIWCLVALFRASPAICRRARARRSSSGAAADLASVGPTPMRLTVGPSASVDRVDYGQRGHCSPPATDLWALALN